MKKVLITGSNGFLGQHLIAKLYNYYDLYGMDRVATKNLDTDHSLVSDIGDKEKVSYIFSKVKPDIVIHLAAIVHKNSSDTSEANYNYVNYECSKNIFDLCKLYNVSKVIFSSTIEVYGDTDEDYIDETTPVNPKSYYAKSKLLAEQYLISLFAETKIEYAILRLCPVYAKDFKMNIEKRVFIKPNEIAYYFKNGSYSYQFLSVNNILEFVSFLLHDRFSSGIYLLSDSVMISAKEIINLFKRYGKVKLTIKLPYKLCEYFILFIESLHNMVSDSDFYLSKRNFKKLFVSKAFSSKKARQLSNCMKWTIETTIYGDSE